MNNIVIEKTEFGLRTVGLLNFGQDEIQLQLTSKDLLADGEDFLHFTVACLAQSERKISAGQTMTYGFWIVKFQPASDGLDVWEYNPPAGEYVLGASLALEYWRDQHQICNHFRADFTPPLLDSLTVVDAGVFEGLPAQGVRYPSPEHMSGWWITTDKYNGDVSTLLREHTFHIAEALPDLASYLALPYGFRFDIHGLSAFAGLDEKVANRSE